MTFYWWSHWFWITLICYLTVPLVVVVHTYPSQDSSQEYNQHRPQTEHTKKPVTKLYQASTTLTWMTESTSAILARNTTADSTRLQTVDATTTPSEAKAKNALNVADYYYYDDDDEVSNKTEPIDLEDVEEEQQQFPADGKMNDIKRSAEQFSNSSPEDIGLNDMPTSAAATTTTTTTTVATTANSVKENNYTNYTEQFVSSTNTSRTPQQHLTTAAIHNSSDTMVASSSYASHSVAASSASMSTLTSGNVTALPHAPATPKIVKTHKPADWLSSMDDMLADAISPPPIRVTTDGTDDKFPFTLENVHKSEDLRRDENEPRRRQSKGLSAEFKPGYINYSPESKNLLTRSASTTVNEYESEENNISSEALSVQRAYFMDVGAISAICFTVFGICCTVGTIGIVLYRRRFLNKPQALSEPDSSVYIDDSTMRVSDNSDEMYSLDNDSFLNSLEAMTIQNYWTDTVKHTKL